MSGRRLRTVGRTEGSRLVVAHRPSVAARADQVIWLEDGRVRAVAPHRELWKEARYRALFGVGGADGPVPRRDHGPLPEGARS